MEIQINKTLKDYLKESENKRDNEYYNALREMGIIVFTSGDKTQ